MNSKDIKEFKKFVKNTLMNKHDMDEINASRAIKESYMSSALKNDSDYVMHDSVEEWADIIYNEYHNLNLRQM